MSIVKKSIWCPIVLIVSAALISPGTALGITYKNGYQYRRAIVLSHAMVSNTDQTNFPVLFSGVYSYLATVSNGGLVQNANGYDIVFSLDPEGATNLAHEIETYDPVTGTVNFWVVIPSLSHTVDTVLYLFYGNSTITTSQENKPGVWQNGYISVYHLSNGTTLNVTDSLNANNGTNQGATPTAGLVDGAASFNGSTSYVSIPAGAFGGYPTTGSTTSYAFTYGAWFKTASSGVILGQTDGTLPGGSPTGWTPAVYVDTIGHIRTSLFWHGSTGAQLVSTKIYNDNHWHYVVDTYGNGIEGLYVDGTPISTQSVSEDSYSATYGYFLGTGDTSGWASSSGTWSYLNGALDEVTTAGVTRSADWIGTEYASQSSPSTFYAVESQSTPSSPPSIQLLSPADGVVGTVVAIQGFSFQDSQGTSTVKFNGISTTPISWNDASIKAPVPAGTTTGNVVVTVGGIASNGVQFTLLPTPSITSLSVTTGAVGASVTITGTNFGSAQGLNSVTFNGTTASSVANWTSTQIVVSVPPGATTGPVVVTASGIPSNGVTFTVVPAPQITSVSPTTGAAGASVMIKGANFGTTQGSGTVSFYGTTASTISSWSASQIVALVPAGAETGTVVVNASGVRSNGVPFVVVATPSIASVSPSSGGVGTPVTITGTNFGEAQGSSTVTFNGKAGAVQSWVASQIVAPVPAAATTGPVIVTVAGVASNALTFTVNSAPSITSLSPGLGPVGTSVTVNGNNFGTTQGGSSITFNGITAAPTSWTNTSIKAPVPSGALTGPVVVTVGGLASNAATFTISSAPTITNVSPTIGPVGTSVTVTGDNFGASKGSSSVTFNGITATPTTWANASIKVPVPTGATTGNVIVTVSGAGSNGVLFTVGSAPNISSLSTTSGDVGTPVTVTGVNFGAAQGASTITFNGTPASVTSWSAGSISTTVPAGATTGNVVVTVGTVASNALSFTVLPTTPSITSIVPAANAVGTGVTIYGTKFGATKGTSTVKFNGKAASTTYWSSQEIIAEVPTGATTGNVVVTVGGVASNGFAFTVSTNPAPYISSLYTGYQGVTVGQSLTVYGGNFGASQGSSTLTLSGQTITGLIWTETDISFHVPAGATSGNLIVTVNALPSNPAYLMVTSNPGISGISPTAGPIGTVVSISGANFGSTQGSSKVLFNNIAATPSSWSPNLVQVPVPAGASTGYVTMQVNGANVVGETIYTVAPGTITSLSPTSGPVGQPVIITGTFEGSASVTFNGTSATPTLSTNTSINTPVPAGATTGNVVVTIAGLPSNGLNFTVTPGPGISSTSPTSGPPGGTVAIYGSGFGPSQSGSTVTFNSTTATPTRWTPTEIDVPVPTGATSGNIVVTVGGLASNSLPFTIVTAPTINSLSFSNGPVGLPVTITGYNFGSSQNGGSVTFSGVSASVSSWSSTSITVSVPAGAKTGNVIVTAGGVASNGTTFTVNNWAAVTSISPMAGPVGTLVTIKGFNFGATQGTSSVNFNGTAGTVQSWAAGSITVLVPSGATTGYLHLVVPGIGTDITVPNFYTVDSTPTISSLSPSSGPVGAAITISGGNFDTYVNQSTITFNGTGATYNVQSWSPSSIVVGVPSGATNGNVVVTVAGKASNGSAFTVAPGPGITSVSNGAISQASGAVGATIAIFGAGFGTTPGASSVTFNGLAAATSYWSDTEVDAIVPSGATSGNLLVKVSGLDSNAINFTVVTPAQVTSVSPTAGPSGASITIQGSGFGSTQNIGDGTSSVYITGPGFSYYVNTITSWSDTTIVATVPGIASLESTSGSVSVMSASSGVTGPGAPFTLLPSSGLTLRVSPGSGPIGTSVTLTPELVGGFGVSQGSSTVTLSGVPATPTNWNDHSVIVPVPAAGFTGAWVVTINGVSMTTGGVPFYVTPVITGVSPPSGTATIPVTISGSGFGASSVGNTVTFTCSSCGGTVVSHIQSWSTNSIVAPVPNLATTGPIVVTSSGVASNAFAFTVPGGIGSATGTVTSTMGGTGIGGAVVTAIQGGVTVASTTTGQNGNYSFPSLTAGTYDVQFAASSYIGAYLSGNVVAAGGSVSVNAALAPAPIITSLSQTWGPPGTSITIKGSNFGSAQSLYSGSVAFNGTAATPTNWSNTSIVVPVPAGATTGPVVVKIAGTASNSVNFSVGSGTLSGTVKSAATGTGIVSAQVQALLSNVVVASATTTSGGTYSISNVGPGTYGLDASATGFGTQVSAGNAVTVGSTTTVNFSLPAPATDSGTVTQSNGTTPISGATVTALQNNVQAGSATTDASGKFTMSALSAGSYVIQAAAQGYDAQQQTATLTAGTTTTTNLSLSGQSTISYSYDQLGRLTGVVDSLNGAATYGYDAVGNITSIGRESISQVNILSFSPMSGAVGSTVTINGTDFSTTRSLDTVTFNGTAAVVASASSTQLVVTVPASATTGKITVSAPAGSATSTSAFTVTASNAPTITGFSPSVGVVGTAITISGTNFDQTSSNNKVLVNTSQVTVGATSTTTNLATSVPVNGVSSGRISVTTPRGQAVSASDFYVVPAAYQGSTVGFTGRTQVNASPTLISLLNGQIAILLFDGTAGERITGVTTNSTWGCGGLQGEFLNPNGSVLNTNGCLGNQSFGPLQLNQTGTYSLVIFPAQGVGQFDIALQSISPDITGILYPTTTGTTLGPLTTTTPGQRYIFTLSGSAGSRISITSWGTYPGCGLQATLQSPSGSAVSGFDACMGTGSQTSPTFSGVFTLAQTGSYVLTLTPGGSNTGTLYLIPYSVPPDPVVPLPMNGQATVTTTVPGQNGHFTFNITSAQAIAMTFTAAGSLNCEWWATLYDPNNKQIGQWQGCNNSTINTGSINLTTTGNYSVLIAPDSHDGWIIGSFTGTLQP